MTSVTKIAVAFVWLLILAFVLNRYVWPDETSIHRKPDGSGGDKTSSTTKSSNTGFVMDDMQNNTDVGRPDFSSLTVEQVAAYWNSRPCNLRHSTKEIGTKEYYNDLEARKYKVEPHIPSFAKFEKWKGKKVLEIGCGLGTDASNFARAGADYHAVDLSIESIKLTKKRFEVFGYKGNIQQANAERLTEYFPEGTKFDLVYSFGVIHHTPHPERVIAEIKKLLKPGGTIKIMMYSRISFKLFWVMKETNMWDFRKMDGLMAKYSEAQVGSPVTYTYTFQELEDLLGPEFKVTEIYKDHIFKWDLEAYRKYEWKLDSMWEGVDEATFRAFEKELGWHTMATATFKGLD